MTLSGGDMRKVINVLQSTWLAYGSVTEETVYSCVGHPLPTDITSIANWLLNENYILAYRSILLLTNYILYYTQLLPDYTLRKGSDNVVFIFNTYSVP